MNNALENILEEARENYLPKSGKPLGLKAQVLIDLGYLRPEFLVEPIKERKINEAYSLFYSDLEVSGLISSSENTNIESVFQEEADTKLLEIVADIDEGLHLKKVPSFGEKSLVVRILHYRLNLLGLYEDFVAGHFSAASYAALDKAAFMIKKSKLTALNLLADIQTYTDAFLKARGYNNCIVSFFTGKEAQKTSIPDYSGKFKRRLKKDLKKHPAIFEKLDDHVFFRRDKKVNLDYLRKLEKEEINRFTLRLLQLHQWMGGHYNGLLDTDFGNYTLNSFINIIGQYNESEAEKVKTEEVLVKVTDNVIVFNALFFLKQYKNENASEDRTLNTLQILSENYHEASEENKEQFRRNFQDGIDEAIKNENKTPETKFGMIRRVFFGIKAFFKKAFKFAKRIFKWIAEKVGKAVDFIQNTLRMIYNYLKQAVKHFIDGVKFLLGKLPVVNKDDQGNLLISNFDFDKDGISIIGSKNDDLINLHLRSVNRRIVSMSFSLALISFLFKTIKGILSSATVVAWPIFAIKLVVAFKKVIESYKLVLTI